jgi:hypothetical protein
LSKSVEKVRGYYIPPGVDAANVINVPPVEISDFSEEPPPEEPPPEEPPPEEPLPEEPPPEEPPPGGGF